MSLLAAEDAVGQAGCGLPLLPAEAETATAPTPAWGRARGTFPAWSPAKEARSRAEGAGGPRSGWRETRGASGWGQGRKGKARGKRERSNQMSRDVLWTSEEPLRRRPLVGRGEVTGMGNGGPAGEVGANGQSWKAERPASYGDGNEFGRVRQVCGGCLRSIPFPYIL